MRAPYARSAAALGSTLAVGLASVTVRADDTTTDEIVVLRDGSTFHGELVEKIPGDHVTLKLANGEIRRLAWRDIQRSSSPQNTPRPAVRPSPASVASGPRLTLESDDPQTTLLSMSESGMIEGAIGGRGYGAGYESWRQACVAPCNDVVDPKLTYRIAGVGITPSGPFVLPQGRSDLLLHVKTGSLALRNTGSFFTWTGVSLAIFSAVVTGISFLIPSPAPGDPDIRGITRTVGLVGLGIGGGMIVIGVPMLVTSGTSVRASTGESLGRTMVGVRWITF